MARSNANIRITLWSIERESILPQKSPQNKFVGLWVSQSTTTGMDQVVDTDVDVDVDVVKHASRAQHQDQEHEDLKHE